MVEYKVAFHSSQLLRMLLSRDKELSISTIERMTKIDPWIEISADFKKPIVGRHYFYILIDNYS